MNLEPIAPHPNANIQQLTNYAVYPLSLSHINFPHLPLAFYLTHYQLCIT